MGRGMSMNGVQLVYLRNTPENRVLVRQAFEIMEADGTVQTVFYDGRVETPEAFETFLFTPGTLPFVIFGDSAPLGMTWVNNISGRAGQGHIVVFRRAWGRRHTVRIGNAVFDYMLTAHDSDGYLFDVLIGICPIRNALVWKLGELCGAIRRCTLPHYIYRDETGQTEDAFLYTVTRESLTR